MKSRVAVMSHQTALSLFELGDFNPAKIHMIVPPTFRRNTQPSKAVVLHRAGLAPAELTNLRGLTVCRPLRALVDLATANPESVGELRPVAVEARRRGLITSQDVSAMGTLEKMTALSNRMKIAPGKKIRRESLHARKRRALVHWCRTLKRR